MLGQPASSQTVCSPSRRTSDLSSVYSGPVFRRVLIHSGLRSMGTWLLRTSRRSSLRPAGSSGDPVAGVGTTGSLMISTVPADDDAPAARSGGVVVTEDRSDRLVVRTRGRALALGGPATGGEGLGGGLLGVRHTVGTVALDELRVTDAE